MEKAPTTLDDLRELLEDNLEATEENNKILKDMRRDALIGGVVKVLVWVVLIGASFYFSIKFLEPYLGSLIGAQEGNQQDIGALLEQYQSLIGD